jgi:hypothetical protein
LQGRPRRRKLVKKLLNHAKSHRKSSQQNARMKLLSPAAKFSLLWRSPTSR